MRKFFAAVLLAVVSMFGAAAVSAQEKGDTQGYVGYQFVRVNADVRNPVFRFDSTTDSNGVNGSVTKFVEDSVGLTGEAAVNFAGGRRDASLATFMGGLTVQANNETVQPFVRGLAGLSRVNSDNEVLGSFLNQTDYSPSFAVGAGLDVKVGNRVALRVVQADYLQTRAFGSVQHNLRLGAGIRF
jgi:hypothetical protein